MNLMDGIGKDMEQIKVILHPLDDIKFYYTGRYIGSISNLESADNPININIFENQYYTYLYFEGLSFAIWFDEFRIIRNEKLMKGDDDYEEKY